MVECKMHLSNIICFTGPLHLYIFHAGSMEKNEVQLYKRIDKSFCVRMGGASKYPTTRTTNPCCCSGLFGQISGSLDTWLWKLPWWKVAQCVVVGERQGSLASHICVPSTMSRKSNYRSSVPLKTNASQSSFPYVFGHAADLCKSHSILRSVPNGG